MIQKGKRILSIRNNYHLMFLLLLMLDALVLCHQDVTSVYLMVAG